MKQLLNNWLKNSHLLNFRLNIGILKQTIFKQHCLLCASSEANNQTICAACLADLPWSHRTSCPQCGLASSGMVCGSCLNSPPDFDATISVFLYAYPVDAMMLRYKYGNMLNLGDTFGEFLPEKICA